MVVMRPDETKRFHVVTYDPWNGIDVVFTSDDRVEAQRRYEGWCSPSSDVVLWDDKENKTIAKSTAGTLVWSTATW